MATTTDPVVLPAPTDATLEAHMGAWHPGVVDLAGWAHHEDHRYLNDDGGPFAGHVHEFGEAE